MAHHLSPSLPDRAPRSAQRVFDGEVIPPQVRFRTAEAEAEAPRHGAWRIFKPLANATLATGVAVFAICLALAGGIYAFATKSQPTESDRTAMALDRLQNDMGRLKAGVETLHPGADLARQDEAVRALKKSVDTLKAELDTLRTNNTAALAQLSAKLDKPDPAPKLTDIATRLDRIEKQVSSSAPAGSIAAPAHAATPVQQTIATQTVDRPLPKPVTLGNWIVRDVYDGIALVEGREGGVREVAPGEFLPGAGEVRSIQRRGRAWIVVTSRGVIDNSTW